MVDYAKLQQTAIRLVEENGREVTFIEHSEVLPDPNKPWEGEADPRATPNSTSAQFAVFVDPASASRLGLSTSQPDLIKRSEQIMIVAPGSEDLLKFQEVLDSDGTYWKILFLETLRPADLTLVSYVGVRR